MEHTPRHGRDSHVTETDRPVLSQSEQAAMAACSDPEN